MSSLTDIIFLLLIFFMLTSNLVNIPSDNLPESDSKTVAATNIVVQVTPDGKYEFKETKLTASRLESAIKREITAMENREEATMTIVAEKDGTFSDVVELMKIAGRLRIKAIIATQPKTS